MKCPKCGADMEKVTHQAIEVDRCTGCKGIWFDMLEHEHLKAMKGSEAIDTGEFRDYKEESILDFFRDLFARERR